MYYWGDSVNVHFGAECNNSALKRQILASPYTITPYEITQTNIDFIAHIFQSDIEILDQDRF